MKVGMVSRTRAMRRSSTYSACSANWPIAKLNVVAEGEPAAPELSDRERCAIGNMARQRAIISALQPRAGESEPVAECLAWMAMDRQARVYLRHMEPSSPRMRPEFVAMQAEHHDAVVTLLGRA